MLTCNFCSKNFSSKFNVNKHLRNNRCSFENINDREKIVLINDKISKYNETSKKINIQHNYIQKNYC